MECDTLTGMKKPTRKAAKKLANDRHKSGFLVRLPESFREPLARLRDRSRRAITVEVQIALERYLTAEGLWPSASQSSS